MLRTAAARLLAVRGGTHGTNAGVVAVARPLLLPRTSVASSCRRRVASAASGGGGVDVNVDRNANDDGALNASKLTSSPPPPPPPTRIQLRPYQERAVNDCLEAIAAGTTRIGVSAPTGSGKTTMFTELIGRLPPRGMGNTHNAPPANRVLIVVNSIELALQAAGAVSRAYPSLLVEIEQGAKFKASGVADVTVATFQTLVRAGGADGQERLAKFDPRGLKAVIVDEAHHAASKSYVRLLSHFDGDVGLSRDERRERRAKEDDAVADAAVSTAPPRIPIIGFSATFSRHDGLALGRIFDRIVYHRDFLEMIDEQWLCPIRFTAIKADLDLAAVRVSPRSGDFLPRSLSSQTNTPVINRLIVGSWLKKASSDRRSTLVFATDVAHTMDLTLQFRQAGIDARYLHGGTPVKERKQLLADFKAGTYPVLINCAILTEGFDLPQIDCVVLARPTRSKNLFSQMIGRGLRLSAETGKRDCLVLDLVGTLERGVVCTPTLFGIDPADADNATLDDLKERLKQRDDDVDADADADPLALHSSPPSRVTFIDYDSPHELQAALTRNNGGSNEIIARLSPNAWVHCGGQVFILEIPRLGFLRVEPDETATSTSTRRVWSATFTRRNADFEESQATTGNTKRYVPYCRPVAILRAGDQQTSDGHHDADDATTAPLDLATVIRLADNYATTHLLRSSPMNPLLRRDAAWRQTPATASQRALVEKQLRGRGKKTRREDGNEIAGVHSTSPSSPSPSPQSPSLDLDALTKGRAAEMLTRLRFGFKKRWESEVRAWNRVAREKEKERERVDRETVRVGDLAE